MKISVITPTKNREDYLKKLYLCLQQQNYKNWEWLILDNSINSSPFFLALKDPSVHYHHTSEELSIGTKRNRLTDMAKGTLIVQCDDDDYYAPQYLAIVQNKLNHADFFNLSSWFCYETTLKEFYYWDTSKVDLTHYMLSPLYPGEDRVIALNQMWDESQQQDFALSCMQGYGFSYAYHKSIRQQCSFEDRNFGEDFAFFKAVIKNGYRTILEPDQQGLVMHLMHGANTAKVFPQFKLPNFIVRKYFPGFHYEN